jgi:hypothetical protein
MKSLLLTLLCAAALFAQESVSRIVKLKHVNPDSLFSVLNVLAGKQVRWQPDAQLRIIALNGPASMLDALEEAIQKLDVPQPALRNVELTFQMLLASPQGESQSISADLNGVVTQLRTVFGFRSFRLMESTVVRAREGKRVETKGIMASVTKADMNALYGITVSNIAITPSEKGANIRLDGLQFSARLPNASGTVLQDAGISTEIDVREGQKVVVGKTSIDNAHQSIFLVVTAKVVD